MRLERREAVPLGLVLAAPVIAVLASAALGSVLIVWSGAPVPGAFAQLLNGAFGSRLGLTETLTRATPLIFTGLAAAVAFRARLWNIGAEGQLYLGALAAALIGASAVQGPSWMMMPAALVLGALAGAGLLLVPALLRTHASVDEVVTTLLLNFVVVLFVSMMIEGPMKDPLAFGWPQSAPVADGVMLPKLVARSRLHLGFAIAIVTAVAVWLYDSRSRYGFEARASGLNPAAARFAGVSVNAVMLRVAVLSGGLAGLAGATEVIGLKGYLTLDLSPGFGYSGIIVAMLAQLHPLGVIGAAIYVAAVFVGAHAMGRAFEVPSFIADVMVACALLTMLVAVLGVQYRVRR
ncbi:MAG: ABC transporter permease [Gammaproteobacteria bacterium]